MILQKQLYAQSLLFYFVKIRQRPFKMEKM